MKDPGCVSQRLRFGVFELDLRAGELHRKGRKIRLQDQPLQIVLMLLEHPSEVVTREELHRKLWPSDTFVDFEHGLNNAVNRLREALGDSAESPRFIETLPRRGYRFIAAVEKVEPTADRGGSALSEEFVAPSGPVRSTHRARWTAGVVLVTAMTVAFLFDLGGVRDHVWTTRATPSVRSLGVLPLENLSGDPSQEYFADGITDALTTDLAQISSLKVISRTSAMQYKGKREPLPDIARELNVDAIVEGSVSWSGERVRVTVQLISGASDRHLWARTYERSMSDILELQSQLAQDIATEIDAKLSPQVEARMNRRRPVDPETYQLYLKGRFFLGQRTKDGMTAAIVFFQQAVDRDSNYADAYVGLADSYNLLYAYGLVRWKEVQQKIDKAIGRALELDPSSSEAETSAAAMAPHDAEAQERFRRAIELNPGNSRAHHWYSRFLGQKGGHQTEAIAEARQALELDPLSPLINDNLGLNYYWAREYEPAISQLKKTLDIDPNFWRAHMSLGVVYEMTGRQADAIAEYQKGLLLRGVDPERVHELRREYESRGWRAYWLARVNEQLVESKTKYIPACDIGRKYLKAGDTDQTFAWFQKAIVEEEGCMDDLKVNPLFDPLRSDPRYLALLRSFDSRH